MTHSDCCTLAVDAGGTSLKAALIPDSPREACLGLLGETFFSVDVPSDGTKEEILGVYRDLARQGAALSEDRHLTLTRIALCTPGPFDYRKGCSLMNHKYRAIRGVSLKPCLREGAGRDCPITFLHDSTAFLLGVRLWGAVCKEDFCGVIIGTGLGFACMKNGKVLEGSGGGPAVSIYARPYLEGISEDYVSKRGILNRYARETGIPPSQLPTVAEVAALAREGQPAALNVFVHTGYHLGQLLLPVLTEHPFDTLVLGGAISKSADLLLEGLSPVLPHVTVVCLPEACIDQAPLLGAANYK